MVLAQDEADRRGLPRRAGHRGGDHRPRLLRRRAAPGDQGRRADRRARRAAHHQRADRGGARLRRSDKDKHRAHRRLRPRRRHVRHLDPRAARRRVRGAARPTATPSSAARTSTARIVDWLADSVPARAPASICARTGWRSSASRRRPSGPSTSCRRRSRPRSTCRSSPPTRAGPLHLAVTIKRGSSSRRWSTPFIERTLEPCQRALARRRPRRRRTSIRSSSSAARRACRACSRWSTEFFGKAAEQGRRTPTRSSRSARRSRAACSRARCRRCCCST